MDEYSQDSPEDTPEREPKPSTARSTRKWKLANKESVAKQQASYHRRNRSKRTAYMRRYMADRRKHPTEPDPWLSM